MHVNSGKKISVVLCLCIISVLIFGCSQKNADNGMFLNSPENAPTSGKTDGESLLFKKLSEEGEYFAASFYPRFNGAVGDGVHDDTEAIQKTLDKAGSAGGGNVYLDRGFYKITSSLKIPSNVKLIGDFKSPAAKLKSDSMTVICVSEDFDLNQSALYLEKNSSVTDLCIYYISQNMLSALEYNYTVNCESGENSGILIKNLMLLNSFKGVYIHSEADSALAENIYMTCLKEGINISGTGNVSLRNINISPSYYISFKPEEDNSTYSEISEYIKNNLYAVRSGSDRLSINGLYADSSKTGIDLYDSSDYAVVTNAQITGAEISVSINGNLNRGAIFTDCLFNVRAGESFGIKAEKSFISSAVFNGCFFTGQPSYSVKAEGDARLSFNSCRFADWREYGLYVGAGIASVSDSYIIPDKSFAFFEDNTAGIFYMNSCFSTLRTEGGQIFTYQTEKPLTADSDKKTYPLNKFNLKNDKIFYASDYGLDTSNPDNRAAVQAAVDAAYAAGGGCVFINEGEYLLSGIIDIKSNVYLTGAGGEISESTVSNSVFCIFADNADNLTLEKLRMSCRVTPANADAGVTETCLYIGGGLVYASDIASDSADYGLYAASASASVSEETTDIIIQNLNIKNCGYGLSIKDKCSADITNAVFGSGSEALVAEKGGEVNLKSSLFAGTHLNTVNSGSGALNILSCIFSDITDVYMKVSAGKTIVKSCVFDKDVSPLHASVHAGSADFYSNIIVSSILFNGTDVCYLKTATEESGKITDILNLKKVDYQTNGDF